MGRTDSSHASSEEARKSAWCAQKRLHSNYYRLTNARKPQNKALAAVARELATLIRSVERMEQPTGIAA